MKAGRLFRLCDFLYAVVHTSYAFHSATSTAFLNVRSDVRNSMHLHEAQRVLILEYDEVAWDVDDAHRQEMLGQEQHHRRGYGA